uniref:Uncharacterized protein n=1 Tax=Anguilla anguilla TaxID=7936 RepID=A0A0E9WM87_ANGAN
MGHAMMLAQELPSRRKFTVNTQFLQLTQVSQHFCRSAAVLSLL